MAELAPATDPAADALVRFLGDARRLFVLTGAGCSTGSGIPDYRDVDGSWKHRRPTTFQRFLESAATRRRYWAGSLVGWERIADAAPNGAHAALARLEAAGGLHWLLTQNVDGLHRRAGNRRLTELHGRLDRVVCLACRVRFPRERFQVALRAANPDWEHDSAAALPKPDGDTGVAADRLDDFRVPDCPRCGGVLKPDVVFFGETVPRERVEEGFARLAEADRVLVVGSSLMIWSGYRFVRRARELGLPVAAVNLGRTRADAELALKVAAPCEEALAAAVARTAAS